MYVANDVLQKCRKRGPEYVNSFRKILPDVFRTFNACSEENIKNDAFRTISIWKDRNVFDSKFCISLENIQRKGSRVASGMSQKASSEIRDLLSKKVIGVTLHFQHLTPIVR